MRKFAIMTACAVAMTSGAALAVDTEDEELNGIGDPLTTSRIDIRGGVFFPPMVMAEVGKTYFIRNNEEIVHNATAIDGSWSTGDIQPGGQAVVHLTASMTRCFESTVNPEYKGAFGDALSGEAPECFELSGAGETDAANNQ
ncbi:hypothetical protein C8N43_3054 [Litoreibacter ponti]|uniref:Plastocyanin n=1 Tax=Litoreibacter ponti TaxID=1510457 RepID=A0A2T6BDX8_9RHOB|nr:hypothetical protein [Litoreibacter ponti]PTX54242.1 hypothetical protein C8N43_3054 [Litoreibacter ponti]